MAFGDTSNPARFGEDQAATSDRELFLKMFGGEVLGAFNEKTVMRGKHRVQTINAGKSFQFPRIWKASSEYLTAGQEMLGNNIDTSEKVITVDALNVAHVEIYDFDDKMSHFEVRSEFAKQLGEALALSFDKNAMRAVILAARESADGPFPAGNVIEDSNLIAAPTTQAQKQAWFDAILSANEDLFGKDVPASQQRYMAVPKAVFNAIRYSYDSNGNYLVANRDFAPSNFGVEGVKEVLEIDGVWVMPLRTIPNTDERADATVYSDYQAAYDTTTGIMWTSDAIGTVELIGVGLETERDVRRQSDFMVARQAVGHGTLRPECAVEFRTGAPTTT